MSDRIRLRLCVACHSRYKRVGVIVRSVSIWREDIDRETAETVAYQWQQQWEHLKQCWPCYVYIRSSFSTASPVLYQQQRFINSIPQVVTSVIFTRAAILFCYFVRFYIVFVFMFYGITMVLLHTELEVLREHRPRPNASIIELPNDFCNAN